MHVEVGWYGGFDLIEELAEFDGAMAGITLADHPAGSDVERGEQRGGAMTFVVMAAPDYRAVMAQADGALHLPAARREGTRQHRLDF